MRESLLMLAVAALVFVAAAQSERANKAESRALEAEQWADTIASQAEEWLELAAIQHAETTQTTEPTNRSTNP